MLAVPKSDHIGSSVGEQLWLSHYENFPQVRSVAHHMSTLPPAMNAAKDIQPSIPTTTNPVPSAIAGTIMAI
jgi:hypothetical protein